MAQLLEMILQKLQKGSDSAGEAGARLGGVLENLNRAFAGLKDATLGLGQVYAAIIPQIKSAVPGALADLGERIKKVTSNLGEGVLRGISAVAPAGGRVRKALGGIGRTAGGIGRAAGGLAQAGGAAVAGGAAAIGGFTSALAGAAAGPIAAFGAMTAVSYAFVGALNPSALLVFNQALRDLTAVIGVALQPIMQVATGVLRQLGAVLLPVMERLKPIIEQIANAFGSVLMVQINALGSIMSAMMPAFKFLGGVVEALVPVFQGLAAFLSGWVEVLAGVFRNLGAALGVDMADVTGGLKTAFQTLSKFTLLAAGHLAVLADKVAGWFGMQTTFAKDFVKGARGALLGEGVERKPAEGTAAAQNAQITGFAEFTKTLAQAAFIAGPAGAQSKDEKQMALWENIAKQMDAIASGENTDDLTQGVMAIQALIATKFDELIAAVKGAVYEPINDFLGGTTQKIRERKHLAEPEMTFGGGGSW